MEKTCTELISAGEHGTDEEYLSCARRAAAYDISYRDDHGKTYSSPYVNTVVYPAPGDPDFHELHEHSDSHFILGKLEHHRYDPTRDTERFQTVLARLRKYDR